MIFASSHYLPAFADEVTTLHLGCSVSPDQEDFKRFQTIAREAIEPLGYTVKLHLLSNREIIQKLRQGQLDGDCGRVIQFPQLSGLDNLVRVETPVVTVNHKIWSPFEHQANGKRPRHDMTLGYYSNVLFFKQIGDRLGYKASRPIDSPAEAIRLLASGEIDELVSHQGALSQYSTQLQELNITHSSVLFSLPVYPYLLDKHRDRLGEIERAIAQYTAHSSDQQKSEQNYPDWDRPDAQAPLLTFSCGIKPDTQLYHHVRYFLSRATAAMGYRLHLQHMPFARETAELLSGRIDGTCGRVSHFASLSDSIVKVTTIAGKSVTKIWGTEPQAEINDASGIAADAKIAYVRGLTNVTKVLQGRQLKMIPVITTEAGFKMLASGRVDYFISDSILDSVALDSAELVSAVYNVGQLGSIDIHPFLHARHQALADDFSRQLDLAQQSSPAQILQDLNIHRPR